jgi:hypothetical protein
VALKEVYQSEVVPAMIKAFGYTNHMQVPQIRKIVINMGVGEATQNADALEAAASDLAKIAGQKPVITKAKRSISAFKVRAGMNVGCKVTLRGERMYDFYDKLVHVVMPQRWNMDPAVAAECPPIVHPEDIASVGQPLTAPPAAPSGGLLPPVAAPTISPAVSSQPASSPH